jgi:hypothetical protein
MSSIAPSPARPALPRLDSDEYMRHALRNRSRQYGDPHTRVPKFPPAFLTVLSHAIGKAAFHELHGPFQRDVSRGEDQVQVIRHDYKLVKQIFLLTPIMKQRVYE